MRQLRATFGCFSFYANKIITTGEGGMVVTDDPALADRARSLKDLSHSPADDFSIPSWALIIE